jgi:hypothetical protein
MDSDIKATPHTNLHPLDYFKMEEALNDAALAKMAFWPLEASIILHGEDLLPANHSGTNFATIHVYSGYIQMNGIFDTLSHSLIVQYTHI